MQHRTASHVRVQPSQTYTTGHILHLKLLCADSAPCVLHQVIGLGWKNYWKVTWNQFDLVLVLSAVVDMIVTLVAGSALKALKVQKIIRLLRLARVMKLIKGLKVGSFNVFAVSNCVSV